VILSDHDREVEEAEEEQDKKVKSKAEKASYLCQLDVLYIPGKSLKCRNMKKGMGFESRPLVLCC
jgi:hypothetical protein